MKSRYLLFLIIIVMLNGGACSHEKITKKTFYIDPDGEIDVLSLRGDIKISTHKGREVRMTAFMRTAAGRPDDTAIRLEADEKHLRLSPGDIQKTSGVIIDYTLEVPEKLRSVHLVARSGNIRAKGAYRKFDFETVNGKIDFQGKFTGSVVSSSNGGIEVRATDTLKGDITARSTNGAVAISLYGDSRFHVEAVTQGGKLETHFKIPIVKTSKGSSIKGSINGGEHQVKINTVNGNIKLLKH